MKPESLLSTMSPRPTTACEWVISWSYLPDPYSISGAFVCGGLFHIPGRPGKPFGTVTENTWPSSPSAFIAWFITSPLRDSVSTAVTRGIFSMTRPFASDVLIAYWLWLT